MSYADTIDRTVGAVLDYYAADVKAFATVDGRLKAADGDREAALKDYLENSDDPQIVKLRDAVKAAQEKMRTLAEKNVKSETLSDEDRNNLNKERDELKEKCVNGVKAVHMIMTTSVGANVDSEKVNAALEEIGTPYKSGRGRAAGTPGSNLPKASVSFVITSDAAPNNPQNFDTFTTAAKHLNISVEALQKFYARAANVEHSEIASVDKPLEFKLTHGQGGDLPASSVDWTVKTTPKERKKPGPKPATAQVSGSPKAA